MSTLDPYRGVGEPREVVDPAVRLESPRPSDNIDFAWLFAAFNKRMRVFMTTLVATIVLVVFFVVVYPPQYTGTARVTINERAVSATPFKDAPVVAQLPALTADVDTEVQVMQSRRVVGLVVDRLHLDHDPEFSGAHVGLKQALTNLSLALLHRPKYKSPRDQVIDAVLGNLQPQRYLTTNAIDINFKDNNPAKAQRIANAFAQAYLDDQVASKSRQNQQATAALVSQIDSMRRVAAEDSARVQAYKVAHNLMTIGATPNAQTLTESEISNYEQSISTAKVEEAAAEAVLHAAQRQVAQGSNGDDLGASLNSGVVTDLRAQRALLSAKLADLQAHYGAKYPDLAQARRQLEDVDEEIQGENRRIISSLSVAADVAQKRLSTLEASLGAAQARLASENLALSGLENLNRTATVSQAIYEAYLDRFKQSVAQATAQTPDADIVSWSGLPADPSFPIVWLFLPLGVVAGILFGSAAVLLAELLDTRMATADDVEQKLHRPYLGGIPLLSSVMSRGRATPLDAVVTEPLSAYSEAFRGLLASLNLAGSDEGLSVVLITSALPREGKTTVAVSLAKTSAQQGIRTALVDCDVRRRGLSRSLSYDDRAPGLMDVLAGNAQLADVVRMDRPSGVFIIPMGQGRAPSDDLLGGEAMDRLLATLRRDYEAVILDAPALQIAASRVLAAKADATVLIVRWRHTGEAALRAAIRLLPLNPSARVGVALNRIDMFQQAKYGFGNPGYIFRKFKQYYA